MTKTKTRRSKKYGIRKSRKNVKKYIEPPMMKENKALETFWQKLASGKYVVLIYKNGKNKMIEMPNSRTQKSTKMYDDFDNNPDIVAVLSSSMSYDAYESLHKKVKDKSVSHVISNYKKYFYYLYPNPSKHDEPPLMKKLMVTK